MANFKLVSLNVSGNNFHKHRSMFTWCHILYSSRDVFGEESEKQWINEWGGKFTIHMEAQILVEL